ncbi:MAG: helix-turn-helix domain-containing protein [Thermoanaerobaculia bacterium]|nr:helix-turn-helix domain-containing protein [Thermoanaerobaculia bacterium]
MALRDAAALPVLEQIREDQEQISEPARRILVRFEQDFLSPDLKVSALLREYKVKGTRSLEELQAVSGLAPSEYLLEARGEVALRLLGTTELSIEVVAELSGFAAIGAFGRTFRRWYGLSPSKYRENVAAARRRGVDLPDPAELRYRRLLPLTREGADPKRLEALMIAEARARGLAPPAVCEPETSEQLEAEAARLWWERLRGLPFAEQRRRLAAGFRFETPAFVVHLLRMSREEGRSSRRRGVEIARLALEKAERLRPHLLEPEHSQLMARAWTTLGNAHRLALEYTLAEEAFANAALLLAQRPAPPALPAELACAQCQLRQYQRRFTDALAFAEQAVALSSEDGDSLATALLCRGGCFEYLGEWERAAADYREVAARLTANMETYRLLVAVQNLAHALVQGGRFAEARAHLQRAYPLCDRLAEAGPKWQLRWLEGLIAGQTGASAAAESHLRTARAGFEALGELGHFAVVSLDLAALLLGGAHSGAVLAVVSEAVPHLEALDLEGEGLAALVLLKQALAAREVDLALVERLRASARRLLGTRP